MCQRKESLDGEPQKRAVSNGKRFRLKNCPAGNCLRLAGCRKENYLKMAKCRRQAAGAEVRCLAAEIRAEGV